MPTRVLRVTILIVVLLLAALAVGLASARMPGEQSKTRHGGLSRVLVLDGSPVHNVGELVMHTGNWGGVGSWPDTGLPYSDAPSAQWPAGSGVEHLYAGGLWVGGIVNGVPSVSTAAFQLEYRPTDDPVDIVYRAKEGAPGGSRLPAPNADDDLDGMVDEDPLDGHDNDNDGMIDEDFAAISDQMFARWYTDTQPITQEIYPEHRPLDIMVRENSYQWEHDDFDDFVGFDYEITNIGTKVIENVYVGVLLDGDVGRRSMPDYWQDDAVALAWNRVKCTEYGPVSFDFAYTYDADGDAGGAPGYFGVVILDHPTDKTGEYAPARLGVTTYAHFSGNLPFEEGGDPTNDFERYEIMSSQTIQRNRAIPSDYRSLVAVGPFMELGPGETLKFSMALVATPRDNDFENVANAVIAYKGQWFDLDNDPMTGISGRETPVPGPVENIVIDPCRPGYDRPINWLSRDPIWINTDCELEAMYEEACTYGAADSLLYRTGSGGREYQVHWWLPGQEVPRPTVTADVKVLPRTLNLRSSGDGLRAHVTLPDEYAAADVDESTLRLNGMVPGQIQSITGNGKMIVRFSRKHLHEALRSGMMEVTVDGHVGDARFAGTDHIQVVAGGGPEKASGVTPAALTLSHSPNPFNPSARIVFELPSDADVTLEVFSANGERVRRLIAGAYPAGRHDVTWRGRDDNGATVASGIYFYRLSAGGETLTRKMVLVK